MPWLLQLSLADLLDMNLPYNKYADKAYNKNAIMVTYPVRFFTGWQKLHRIMHKFFSLIHNQKKLIIKV